MSAYLSPRSRCHPVFVASPAVYRNESLRLLFVLFNYPKQACFDAVSHDPNQSMTREKATWQNVAAVSRYQSVELNLRK